MACSFPNLNQHTMSGMTNLTDHDNTDCKICVLNMGKWVDKKEMQRFLESIHLKATSVQKMREKTFGFLSFESNAKRDQALKILSSATFQGKVLEVKAAKPKKSMQNFKRKRTDQPASCSSEKKTKNDNETEAEPEVGEPKSILDIVTPWHGIPYTEQLAQKESDMRKVLIKCTRQTRKEYQQKLKRSTKAKSQSIVPSWIDAQGSKYMISQGSNELYQHTHATTWKCLSNLENKDKAKSINVRQMLSFAGELISIQDDNKIYRWTSSGWLAFGQGPEAGSITAMTSYKGKLICALTNGAIVQTKLLSPVFESEWEMIGQVDVTSPVIAMTMHNTRLFVLTLAPTFFWIQFQAFEKDSAMTKGCQVWPVNPEFIQSHFDSLKESLISVDSHNGELIFCSSSGTLLHFRVEDNISSSSKSKAESNALTVETQVQAQLDELVDHIIEQETRMSGAFLTLASQINVLPEDSSSLKIKCLITHKGLCCEMQNILASPVQLAYRNKCEFSIGFNRENEPTVGFRTGSYKAGSISIEHPMSCGHISSRMKKVVAAMQHIVTTSSEYCPPYHRETKEGVWRQLFIRASERTQDMFVVLEANPANVASAEIWQQEKKRLTEIFRHQVPEISSLAVMEYEGVSTPASDHPLEVLYGPSYCREILCGLTFHISPQAFFQVNTAAAEVLYRKILDLAHLSSNSVLYDVCCGTGTIGLCAAASTDVGQVIGIELCEAAIADANVNLQINAQKSKMEFIHSKAEDVMKTLLIAQQRQEQQREDKKDIVAIVDPPRSGLHINVIRAMRHCAPLRKIIYVSCNPTVSLIQDTARLCGPASASVVGQAFRPVAAVPVDLFPDTAHCEMVMVFER